MESNPQLLSVTSTALKRIESCQLANLLKFAPLSELDLTCLARITVLYDGIMGGGDTRAY